MAWGLLWECQYWLRCRQSASVAPLIWTGGQPRAPAFPLRVLQAERSLTWSRAQSDDLQLVPSANVAWTALSSATTANSSLNLYQGPLAGIRLNVAAISSATLTLRILQEMP